MFSCWMIKKLKKFNPLWHEDLFYRKSNNASVEYRMLAIFDKCKSYHVKLNVFFVCDSTFCTHCSSVMKK